MRRWRDRVEAGQALARELEPLKGRDDVLVLALPRGGVPVAAEIARELRAPLDVFVVRKLGVPGHEELAMGALASGGVRVVNEEILRGLGLNAATLDAAARREQAELERREREYRGDRPTAVVAGRVVVLVDDGLATGSTMRAAVAALRRLSPARLIVAVPVGAPDTCAQLEREVDELHCPLRPDSFMSVGSWYVDFAQTSDAEVRALLSR